MFQLLHLKPWKAPDMEKATDVADISCTQIHPVLWPDIMEKATEMADISFIIYYHV